jgi:hypothetical protein
MKAPRICSSRRSRNSSQNNVSMTRLLSVLLVLSIAGVSMSFGQLLAYRSEVREKGWAVPDLSSIKLMRTEKISRTDGSILLRDVYDGQRHRPSTLLEIRKQGKRITYILRCEFDWIDAYRMSGQTFAVDGHCGFVYTQYSRFKGTLLSETGSLAGITRYTFYDEDGDGKFERRYNSSPGDKNFRILIPDWIKKRSVSPQPAGQEQDRQDDQDHDDDL